MVYLVMCIKNLYHNMHQYQWVLVQLLCNTGTLLLLSCDILVLLFELLRCLQYL